jgi:hypothetical protein
LSIGTAKAICVDPKTHNIYFFKPKRGPAPCATWWDAAAGVGSRLMGTWLARSDYRRVVYRDQAVEIAK